MYFKLAKAGFFLCSLGSGWKKESARPEYIQMLASSFSNFQSLSGPAVLCGSVSCAGTSCLGTQATVHIYSHLITAAAAGQASNMNSSQYSSPYLQFNPAVVAPVRNVMLPLPSVKLDYCTLPIQSRSNHLC